MVELNKVVKGIETSKRTGCAMEEWKHVSSKKWRNGNNIGHKNYSG